MNHIQQDVEQGIELSPTTLTDLTAASVEEPPIFDEPDALNPELTDTSHDWKLAVAYTTGWVVGVPAGMSGLMLGLGLLTSYTNPSQIDASWEGVGEAVRGGLGMCATMAAPFVVGGLAGVSASAITYGFCDIVERAKNCLQSASSDAVQYEPVSRGPTLTLP